MIVKPWKPIGTSNLCQEIVLPSFNQPKEGPKLKELTFPIDRAYELSKNDNIIFEDENNKTILARVIGIRRLNSEPTKAITVQIYNYKKRFIIAIRNPRKATKAEVNEITENNPAWFI